VSGRTFLVVFVWGPTKESDSKRQKAQLIEFGMVEFIEYR